MAVPCVALACGEGFNEGAEAGFEIVHEGNIAAVARSNTYPPNQRGNSFTPGAKAKAAAFAGISSLAVHLGG